MSTTPMASLNFDVINILRIHVTWNMLKTTKDMRMNSHQNDIVYCTVNISIIIYDPKDI